MPLDQPALLEWSPSAAPSDDQLQVLRMDMEWTAEHSITFLDDNFDLTVNGLDYLDGIPSTTILDTCPSIDGSTAQRSPLSSAGQHPQSPHEALLSSRDGDDWEPSPQNDFNESIELSSASCLPDSPQFFEWCRSFKQWVSDHHSLLFVNRTTIGQDSKPDKSCLCHMALITLQLQRKDTYNIQPEGTLEASMYLQRLLEWTWNQNKNCFTCHEDDLAKFIVASVANDVVGIYRKIIAEDEVTRRGATHDPVQPRLAKRRVFSLDRADEEQLLSQQGLKAHLNLRQMTETTATSLLGRTTLTFGTKTIDGVAKTAFLRRLIGLKLRQIGRLVQELSSDERAVEPSRGLLAQTLRVMVPGVLDNVNVITGMIQTDL
ncbi:hypothetical protein VSDG_05044 [Cytospora chrysosperma]|uniref:Uncharacterized protein n=1 Tax=Cytospora chrysosperma TaxID=252740 RepID=A0A423VYI4_CYTCH|nr:hypothetical protein VSDG_05044 [Valsa sordida]